MSRVFKDRVAMITGASQGIGEAIAHVGAESDADLKAL